MRKKKIYCPANGWDCPYYKKGECGIENPIKEGFFHELLSDGAEMRRFFFTLVK